jgi:hypothetical protein
MISSTVGAGIAVGEVVGRRDRGVNAAAPSHHGSGVLRRT